VRCSTPRGVGTEGAERPGNRGIAHAQNKYLPPVAYALDREHVDLAAGRLPVINGKYGKSRELALHPSSVIALREYAEHRDYLCPRPAAPGFFVSMSGERLHESSTDTAFRRLAGQAGLEPRSARSTPCLKSLRHSFAVSTLIGWYRDGKDVNAQLPLLSTWLGHVAPSSTYWYYS
jgi:integrase/recombinase XerD